MGQPDVQEKMPFSSLTLFVALKKKKKKKASRRDGISDPVGEGRHKGGMVVGGCQERTVLELSLSKSAKNEAFSAMLGQADLWFDK